MTAMRKPEVSQVHRQDGGPWAETETKGGGTVRVGISSVMIRGNRKATPIRTDANNTRSEIGNDTTTPSPYDM